VANKPSEQGADSSPAATAGGVNPTSTPTPHSLWRLRPTAAGPTTRRRTTPLRPPSSASTRRSPPPRAHPLHRRRRAPRPRLPRRRQLARRLGRRRSQPHLAVRGNHPLTTPSPLLGRACVAKHEIFFDASLALYQILRVA
jgi:hypothetical protein